MVYERHQTDRSDRESHLRGRLPHQMRRQSLHIDVKEVMRQIEKPLHELPLDHRTLT